MDERRFPVVDSITVLKLGRYDRIVLVASLSVPLDLTQPRADTSEDFPRSRQSTVSVPSFLSSFLSLLPLFCIFC